MSKFIEHFSQNFVGESLLEIFDFDNLAQVFHFACYIFIKNMNKSNKCMQTSMKESHMTKKTYTSLFKPLILAMFKILP